jgi:putative two-component system response regulator
LCLVFFFSYLAADLYDNIKHTSDVYNEELQEKSRQISEMAVQTITTIANTIDAKDEYTEGHSNRVAQYSRMLAKKLGKSDEEADEIYNIALLHDIGKIGVPDSILNKPGKLTDEEFKMIKQHPSIGGKILKDVKSFPNLEVGARYHHERFDGRGYPEGLAGEDIPEIARIICVADSFDAMNSNRVYRRHFTREYIRSELERCQGSQFDPAVAQAMLELMDEEALDEVDQRETLLSIDADNGEHQPKYDGIDRRIHDTPEVKKELEEVSNRIR